MTTSKRLQTIAIAIGLTLSFAACSGDDKPAATTAATTAVSGSDVTDASMAAATTMAPPSTLAPGSQIEPGSIDSEIVVGLSASCEEALAPIRALEEKYVSGLLIDVEEDNVALFAAKADAKASCTPEEYAKFETDELLGWENGSTS